MDIETSYLEILKVCKLFKHVAFLTIL